MEETHLALVRRARRMGRILAATYPDAHCELDFRNPFELLVATVLSAQCTDKRVNSVTPQLFARYPEPEALAVASLADLEEILRPLGFFRTKAKSLHGLAAGLVDRFDGEVPARLKDLVTLPGVGRKTANVILGNAFGIPGFPVDTHILRLSRRFGWTASDDPVVIERELCGLFPKRDWVDLSHQIITLGRRVCVARRPKCEQCPLSALCPASRAIRG